MTTKSFNIDTVAAELDVNPFLRAGNRQQVLVGLGRGVQTEMIEPQKLVFKAIRREAPFLLGRSLSIGLQFLPVNVDEFRTPARASREGRATLEPGLQQPR